MKTHWGLISAISLFLATCLGAEDRPLTIIKEPAPRYPIVTGSDPSPRGSVTLVMAINAEGQLIDSIVTEYTHIEFAREVLAVVPMWTFRPSIVNGQPIGTRQEITVKFEPDRMIRELFPVNTMSRRFEGLIPPRQTEVYAKSKDLDAPLRVIAAPAPPSFPIPEDMEVVLDFYVDKSGVPRMPVIRTSDKPELAQLAIETLMKWRFVPPTRDGVPVITRATQRFVFHGQEIAETSSSEQEPS